MPSILAMCSSEKENYLDKVLACFQKLQSTSVASEINIEIYTRKTQEKEKYILK